ncbi:hypothetical protein OC834_004427 [Tilletia horrida]|uniref:Branchpoint-bridging protein n=1 Tax=Tilletia horrida TaxID=155126 RepID=A0AAN6GEL5_9BASI|nr:hypothetical protein OC834_004427 [Tilletia horrida]KAK0531962.1 hypothetical protein OC835_003492 [Tilletia horrida]KAK0536483.1 hypothetical protein OC842_001973 [Tilletia horrida]KAK0566695.1 hypothetical protein OC844_000601 [Tilletia horrida]
MSWRSAAQQTGSNVAPLTAPRRWGGGAAAGATSGDAGSPTGGPAIKREREDEAAPGEAGGDANAPRKRRSRWGDASDKVVVPTAITGHVSAEELDKYAIQVRLEEIATKLRTGDYVPPDRERSPSPIPTYDAHGRRTNTREVRYRKKLEDERVELIDRQMKLDPNYRPPAEYHAARRNMRPQEKVYLPLKEFPEINFFGLLVGPRGNSLKRMERESGAKISIRGRGSVKDGKGRGGDEDEEEMHCVVTADDDEKVKHCVRLINEIIATAASTPEQNNDHKRNQLRELAALNGTLRDDENQICQNCGEKGHRKFECPKERNWTANIICHRCGGQGHLARDCTAGRGGPPNGFGGPPGPGGGGGGGPGGPENGGNSAFDSEYAQLLAELGEGGGGGGGAAGGPGGGGAPSGPGGPGGPHGGGGPAGSPDGPGAGPGARGWGADGYGGLNRPAFKPSGRIPPWRDPTVWNTPVAMGPMGGGMGRGGGGGRPGLGMGMGGGGGGGYGQGQYGSGQGQGFFPGGAGPAQGSYGGGGGYAGQDAGYGARGGASGYGGGQGGYPAAGGGGADGQRDYSAEWAAYYAAQGAGANGGAAQGAAAGAGAGEGGEQKDYSKEWEEYYRQQGLLPGGQAPGSSQGQGQG